VKTWVAQNNTPVGAWILLVKCHGELENDKLLYNNGTTTVLLRPYVQGVLRVTPHVHLIRCSDRDITGDWTWHMFIRGSDISWGEIRYFHTFWGSIRTMFNCCHDGWQNAYRFSSEGHMTGDWTYGRNSTVFNISLWVLSRFGRWIHVLIHLNEAFSTCERPLKRAPAFLCNCRVYVAGTRRRGWISLWVLSRFGRWIHVLTHLNEAFLTRERPLKRAPAFSCNCRFYVAGTRRRGWICVREYYIFSRDEYMY